MIGPMSSSLALAQRTASKARANMDAMSRQIATGQKVASVKDDGAAWTRAAALKSDKVTWTWRHEALSAFAGRAALSQTVVEEGAKVQLDAQKILAQAANFEPGSSERQRLNMEWEDLRAKADSIGVMYNEARAQHGAGSQVEQDGVAGRWVFDPFAPDSFLDRIVVQDAWWLGWGTIGIGTAGYTTTVAAVETNFLNASSAQMSAAANELLNSTSAGIARTNINAVPRIGADVNAIDRFRDIAGERVDSLDGAIGSLTDADLGKASTQLRQSEARQQLALDTIRTALSAYGNFAGGLLGNVQRTQRGVLA
jgi:flagellin